MKTISLASLGFALFVALGVVASPLNPDPLASSGLDKKSDNAVEVKYDGKCTKSTNQCKYTAQNGRDALCKCHFKKCTHDGAGCYFDTYKRECYCN